MYRPLELNHLNLAGTLCPLISNPPFPRPTHAGSGELEEHLMSPSFPHRVYGLYLMTVSGVVLKNFFSDHSG